MRIFLRKIPPLRGKYGMKAMTRYIAVIDGEPGAYGVSFPDLPGCVAMASTYDEALSEAVSVLREFVVAARAFGAPLAPPSEARRLLEDEAVKSMVLEGAFLVPIPLIEETGRPVRANLSLDPAVLARIDAAAERLRITRSATIELLALRHIAELA
jgi:predicted RNase H-like HicB family nuclease